MKSYTDLEQSQKLAEILPLDSADMYYYKDYVHAIMSTYHPNIVIPSFGVRNIPNYEEGDIPCWGLVALLDILPKVIDNETLFIETSPALWHIGYRNVYTARADNPVDACVEMIIKLHERKIL